MNWNKVITLSFTNRELGIASMTLLGLAVSAFAVLDMLGMAY